MRVLSRERPQHGATGVIALSPECSVYRTPTSDVSDIGERQRTGSRAVDIREAVLDREAGGH
jgi:hypothetical protein